MESFSHDEIEFLQQSGLFAWKERLTRRLQGELTALHEALATRVVPESLLVPDGIDWTRWQVVRGERFHDRPYAYLDYPQFFSRTAKCTYRSMFWWGEGLFFAMMLEGELLDRYIENLDRRYAAVADRELSLSLADTPWEWAASGRTVLPIRSDTRDAVMAALRNRSVLKIQRVVALDRLIEPHVIVREGVATFESLRPVIAKNIPLFITGEQGGT